MSGNVLQQIIQLLVPAAIAVVTGLIAIGLQVFKNYVNSKIRNENLKLALLQLDDAVATATKEMEQTVRPTLSDGKLTDDEKKKIKNLAMEKANSLLTGDVKAVLDAASISLVNVLQSKIEGALHDLKSKKSG